MKGLARGAACAAVGWMAALAPAPGRAVPPSAPAPPSIPVESFTLENGMRFLVVDRPGTTTVSAGWVARVGSANEEAGATGLTHLLEHMLFKGSRTIGGVDPAREARGMEREDRLWAELAAASRSGGRSAEELDQLERRAAKASEELTALSEAGAFQRIYSQEGATQLNGVTMADMTLFFVTVPANKLELWFWMESDRLLEPILRGFYLERKVVREERRQRVESSPTGLLMEELEALFWQDHPYASPPSGRPEDLAVALRADALRHFERFYGPANLTAVLVGEVDLPRVKGWAERYFGRLGAAPRPPGVPAPRSEGIAARRMDQACACRSRVEALFHTVPFAHPDSTALELLAGVLNGRTGRLYRSLVLGRELAFSAAATQESRRWAGAFSLSAEAADEASPAALLAALDQEIASLAETPVPEAELAKVKNQILADSFRRLEEPQSLMRQLLLYEGLGDGRGQDAGRLIEERTEALLAVTAEQVRAVAERYLKPERRTVGLFARVESEAGD